MEDICNYLLEHKEVLDRVERAGSGGKAVFVMFDDETEAAAAAAGLEIAHPSAELRHRLDSKIVTTQLGNEAGVPSAPNTLGHATSYDELTALAESAGLGDDLVVQTPYGDSGKTTFFIRGQRDWDEYAGDMADQELKVMKRINNRAAAVEAVLTRHGTIVGPLMTDLTGHPELTPHKGGWCGNDVFPDALSPEHRERARMLTQKLGDRLAVEGYRGFMEIDYLADVDTGGVVGHALDDPADVRELAGVVERPVEHLAVVGRPGLGVARLLGERGDEVVVHARARQYAGRGRAVLAGVEVAGDRDVLGGELEVRVVEDDHRRLAAELEVDLLDVVGGRLRDRDTGADAAGDRRHRGNRVADERRARVTVAADDVEDARRQELGHQLGHPDRARGRGVGRLEHHRVAGGDRRRPLPDGHHCRVVPGRDRGADADRLAPHVRRVAAHVLAGRLALEYAGGAGEEADLVGHRRDLLRCRQLLRLARVLRLDVDKLVGALLDRVGDPQQRALALARRGVTPALERARGVLERRVDVGLPRQCGVREDLAGARIGQLGGLPVGGGDALAVDEVGDLDHRSSCEWQRGSLGATSSAGLRTKKPVGLSQNETVSTDITGHSSGRVM